MDHRGILGMYHCIDKRRNHRKFYHVLWDNNKRKYLCKYGRIGNVNPNLKYYDYTFNQMKKLIDSKLKKGYRKVPGHPTEIGHPNNAEDYINNIA